MECHAHTVRQSMCALKYAKKCAGYGASDGSKHIFTALPLMVESESVHLSFNNIFKHSELLS